MRIRTFAYVGGIPSEEEDMMARKLGIILAPVSKDIAAFELLKLNFDGAVTRDCHHFSLYINSMLVGVFYENTFTIYTLGYDERGKPELIEYEKAHECVD